MGKSWTCVAREVRGKLSREASMEYLQTSLNQTSTIKSITMFNRIATSWVKAAINALECRICFPPSSQPEILPEDKESQLQIFPFLH